MGATGRNRLAEASPFKCLYGSIMRRPVRTLTLEPGETIGAIAIAGATAIGAALGRALGPTPVLALGFTLGTALGPTLVVALGCTLGIALGPTLVVALGFTFGTASGATLVAALGLTLVFCARPTLLSRPSSIPQIITFFIH
jgi:hypothetical protein